MRILIALCSAFVGFGFPVAGMGFAAAQKNIVLIVVDDQGFQAGCYNNRVIKTPHIDQLAADGTRFSHAFCTTASCSASRSVILSGLLNHANGQYGHAHGYNHFRTKERVQTLPVVLSRSGYRTCSIGKFHVAPEEVYHFDEYRNEGVQGNRNAVRMAKNARDFITAVDERPFFLYFCTSDPHRGGGSDGFANFNDVPDKYPGVHRVIYDPDDVEVPPWLPNQPEVRQELAEYYQAISRLDQGLGELVRALKETGHYEDTIIFFLSDNGPPFPGAKTTLYEPGMNLPLIVRLPGQKKQGITSDAMVNWADLAPTIYEYAGVDPPDGLHGRSFLSLVENEKSQGWDQVFASHTFHEITMYYPMRVVRTRRYKYTLNLASQLPYPFASDLYASPTWQGVLARGDEMFGKRSVQAYLQRPRHELYDLESDPHETKNLAQSSEHSELLAGFQAKLKAWQQQTNDPWVLKYEYE